MGDNHESVILEKIKNVHNEINNMNDKIEKGFTGVHARQDTANGRTGKLEGEMRSVEQRMEDDIRTLRKELSDLHAKSEAVEQKLKNERIIWMLVVVLVGIISGVIGNIINGSL